jgi:aminoglycoside phosphotransferase (APT) family kinase protein
VDQTDSLLFPVLAPGEDDHVSREAVIRHPRGNELLSRCEERREDLVVVEPVYVHHDYWAGNTLWLESRLVAVVDWEGGSIGDPAIDVAYCSFDMRLLGMDEAAAHFVDVYSYESGRGLENLDYWNLMALCRPMPDVALWVPGWKAMGVGISTEKARARHDRLIGEALEREDQ